MEFDMFIDRRERISDDNIVEYGIHKMSHIGRRFFVAKYEHIEFFYPNFFDYSTGRPMKSYMAS